MIPFRCAPYSLDSAEMSSERSAIRDSVSGRLPKARAGNSARDCDHATLRVTGTDDAYFDRAQRSRDVGTAIGVPEKQITCLELLLNECGGPRRQHRVSSALFGLG
jgi:hypothetical protein